MKVLVDILLGRSDLSVARVSGAVAEDIRRFLRVVGKGGLQKVRIFQGGYFQNKFLVQKAESVDGLDSTGLLGQC